MRRSINPAVLVTVWNPTEIKHRCSKTSTNKTSFGERVRLYCVNSPLTLTTIHKDVGVDNTTFSAWIYQGVKPRFHNMIRICKHIAKHEKKTFASVYNELCPLWRSHGKK